MATVLVVDDEESMAWAVTYWLRTAGHTPIVAATGAAALQAAGAHPDLILLDLGLPDLPGAEVLRRLKAQPETARIPVVIVSGQPGRRGARGRQRCPRRGGHPAEAAAISGAVRRAGRRAGRPR